MANNVSIMESKIPIRVFSTINEWIDFVFIVNKEDAERAAEKLDAAFGEWFDSDTCEAIGEWLCQTLEDFEIEYEMLYKSDDEE